MAMAAATPGIRAVGVDLAAEPIAEATAAAKEIGLDNVEFHQADVRALTDGRLGEFDYIVAHGVYGWIPEDARDALLALIGGSLTAAGLAYVSYNAQPGGYFRKMLRDVGLWHARDERRRVGARGQGAGALRVPQGAAGHQRRHLRRAARARDPGARRRPAVPARARRPQRGLASGVVRRVRRPCRPPRPRLRRRGRPVQSPHRDAPGGRRGGGVAAGGRRPDRVRELQRSADRAPLPSERALPRGRGGRNRARARARAAAALGRSSEGRAARGRPGRRRVRRAGPLPPACGGVRRAARRARRRRRRRSRRR